ncbi:peptidase, M48 family [Geotalea daltonii FRC-32]|uniref:Peptidase, M48 family n=1 Tax=Geotalea daltonii (strain DSM 22248 / JCM 15807 / FRC-32) TaxID=316067 RepID=B9M1V1_GEODF|nr:M48 family metallopeptidase [Geotalea daltonii]ACM19247.1 peptidase, M48 family [Geotalea daltonii FRC-32]
MTLTALICYLLVAAAGYFLRFLNLQHLKKHGSEIPPGFEEAIDAGTLAKTSAYTVEQSRLGLVESIFDNILLLLFLFGGLITVYDRFIASISSSFIWNGVLFFLILTLIQTLLDLPFSLYGTFRLEKRFGFNTTTPQVWVSDLFKSTALSAVILVMLTSGALALVQWSPQLWWLWVWAFFAAVSIFFMYVSPYIIEPLFHKFEPVKDAELEGEIRDLMEKAGLHVSRVMQMDASRRSRHSNAYFTGIGRVKRIVLYDTLLEQMDRHEILAILAHEVGHWKKGHVWKRLVTTEISALAALYLSYLLLEWGGLPSVLGLTQLSFAGQLVVLGFISSVIMFPFTAVSSWFSRRHEWEADQFSRELTGNPAALATALVKLNRENLGNLHPHPVYAKFYYSHPPVVERVARLRQP